MGALQQFFIPIIVILVVLALVVAMALFSRNYIKVPPNAVAVLSGRKWRCAKRSATTGQRVDGRNGTRCRHHIANDGCGPR